MLAITRKEDGKATLDLSGYSVYGMDIETHDPTLKKKKGNTFEGSAWVNGEGELLYTGIHNARTGEDWSLKGKDKRIKNILLDEKAIVIGHNFSYDLPWLEKEFGIEKKTKATILDSMIAEFLLDEYCPKDLDSLAKKRLGIPKKKNELEAWALREGLKGDFREHLKAAPRELVDPYVISDAKISAQLLRQQLPLLIKENLIEPFMRECKLIPVITHMKRVGMRVDRAAKKRNFDLLNKEYQSLMKKFTAEYGTLNVNSPKQMREFCDKHSIPYQLKCRIKGKNGVSFLGNERDAVKTVKQDIHGFRVEKKEIRTFVEQEAVPSISKTLEYLGYDFTMNASLDKYFLEEKKFDFPSIAMIIELKKMKSTLSKFLGTEFDRFIAKDGKIHPSFHISKDDNNGAVSGRFSCSAPNLQQVQSKGEAADLALALLCRETLIPEDNCWLLKIDYSQIEYRLLVHYATGEGAEEARQKFRDNPDTDYHKFVMSVTGLARKFAKNCNFGVMYGMGISTMMKAFGWLKEQAEEIMDTYGAALPYVASTMKAVTKRATKYKFIRTIGGRKARLKHPDLAFTFLNRLNQGGSADIMKEAMVQAWEQGVFDILIPHITVHDELVCSVPKTKEGLAAVAKLRHIMENCLPLSVPMLAEPELGINWYDVGTPYILDSDEVPTVYYIHKLDGDDWQKQLKDFAGADKVKTKRGLVAPKEGQYIIRNIDTGMFAVTSDEKKVKEFRIAA